MYIIPKIIDGALDSAVLWLAYRQIKKPFDPTRPMTFASMHAHYSHVLGQIGRDWRKVPLSSVRRNTRKSAKDTISAFYASYEWRKLRYQVLQRDGAKCALCGAGKEHGAVLNVDHIKPLRKYWEMRLDPDNLQVLCGACNHGKGNWDETDWRAKPEVIWDEDTTWADVEGQTVQ